MRRDSALIHPAKPLAPLLQAATVLLLRDSPQGVQVLMTRRATTASFAPGAYVFPGGGIEADDQSYASNQHQGDTNTSKYATNLVASRDSQTPEQISWALAAIRESFEELGIVLARQKNGEWVTQTQVTQLHRDAHFYTQMAAKEFQLAAKDVYVLARWITDRDMPKRFNVPFLVARVPEGQTPVADEKEQFAPQWVSPKEALARHEAGGFFMIFPTVRTLQRLATYASVADVLQACASGQPLWTSCPRAGLMHGKEARFMEHEAAYGELAMVCPYGQMVHELAWQHDKPVQLLQHVWRLTAPNPGKMTGPGTNTYIIGMPDKGYLVIDPGPDISTHIDAIIQATAGDIVAIVCTHSHADHSPAAKPLQIRVMEMSNTVPAALTSEFAKHICPILGLPSAATARANAHFEPDIALKNMEHLDVYFRSTYDEAPAEMDLQVVFTPGHAANHICLILPSDGLLFSGDHILNGSTTVIDPPDGDMTDYLESLDILHALCKLHDLRFILPAHGYVLSMCEPAFALAKPDTQNPVDASRSDALSDSRGGAQRAIAALKAHRLKREAKILAALALRPGASAQELLPMAYDDVDPQLWPIASRSLAAHLDKINQKC
jgi:recombination protein RecT